MRILVGGMVFLLICFVGISAQAQDSWVLYDDFNSEFLDIGKWTTSERRDPGVMILESVRELHGGRLHMMGRTFGNTIPNAYPNPPYSGTRAGDVNSSFGFANVFQSLKVSIKVNDVEVTGCPDFNTTASQSRARFAAAFFNAGIIPSPPSPLPPVWPGKISDVLVLVRIQRKSDSADKPQLLEVWADLGRCTDPNCDGASGDGISSLLLGDIMLGQWANIEIDWDIDNSLFNVKLNKEPTMTLSYYIRLLHPPIWSVNPVSSPGNTLGVANRIANCPADERAMGFIDAEFENIYVRELPSP